MQALLAALNGLHLQKIVAASTYGAQKGDDIADLGTLYKLEQGLSTVQIPVAIIRSAYYMSNWATVLEAVKKDEVLPTFYPADFKLPMVAPEDIGIFAAELMLNEMTDLHFMEGPRPYSPVDVAAAFSVALHQPVKMVSTPESQWLNSLQRTGFSFKAAEYMVNMIRLMLQEKNWNRRSAPRRDHFTRVYQFNQRLNDTAMAFRHGTNLSRNDTKSLADANR